MATTSVPSLAGLSASVTRILSLTGFAKELKTKDIHQAFSEWEGANGGFKIKWKDDTSLLIVFQDASIAKRAYLSTICSPPAILSGPDATAIIKPYDGPDAQTVIQSVNSRSGGHNSSASRGGSISINQHNPRSASMSMGMGGMNTFPSHRSNNNLRAGIPENAAVGASSADREPSPTLPNLPAHPTLNALISSSLEQDPSAAANGNGNVGAEPGSTPPRIGDPGKRMVGAALGVRHPGLAPRAVNGNANGNGNGGGMQAMQRAMGGLTVAE